MALSQSALSELLDVFRAGDGVDLIRESVRTVLQELIEAEATEVIGAGRYERNETRVTDRNGSRPRLLTTKAGDVALSIPKLRAGSFFPAVLQPRRRIDQALYAVVMEAYVHGVSTRAVDDLVVAMGGSGISKSEVSRICHRLDEAVGAFRTRRLDHTEFPYVFLDATYLHVRTGTAAGGQVTSKAVVVATGVTADGRREILGLDVGDSEDEVFWRAFLTGLKKRGLAGVRLVVSDQHAGLVAALRRGFQGVAHQRCRVHFIRNLLAHVPKAQVDMVAAVFRTIFAQPDPDSMATTWDQVRDQLADRFPKIGRRWTTRRSRSWRSTPSRERTGAKSGRPTRSSGSTRRSNDAPGLSGFSRTRPPSSAWSADRPSTSSPHSPSARSPKLAPLGRSMPMWRSPACWPGSRPTACPTAAPKPSTVIIEKTRRLAHGFQHLRALPPQ